MTRSWRPGGVALLERELTLPPDHTSARAARRQVREVLETTQKMAWADAAELAVSEVVTNALLHAHTPLDVALVVFPDRVCVEVRDRSPVLPVAREYDEQASTGRGLGLVAAVAADCGILSLGDEGKVIWFCIADDADHGVGDLRTPSAWSLEEAPEGSHEATVSNVVLLRMPAALWLSALQHHDAQLRELALYSAEHSVDIDFERVDRARTAISDAVTREVEVAQAAGVARPVVPPGHPSPLPWVPTDLNVQLHVPEDDVTAFMALPDALDLAERLAISGQLLVNPGLPEIIAVRDWACEQVVAQLAGMPPAAWPGTAQERFETESHAVAHPDDLSWDVAAARDADQGVVAADEANRIVAISRPLAAELGWRPEDLVGRRVVTLIPHHLREAHVAGFSRHLSTGEAHVLGVPLELPVLRADGSEVLCSFMIERVAAGSNRTVYLAWIEPVAR